MRVLHICTEKSWRGGENQIRLFIEGSFRFGVVNFVAVPKSGRSYPKFLKLVDTLGLSSSSAYSPFSIYQIVQFCKKNQIEVLDGQGSGGLGLALWVKKFLPHLKLITHRRVDDKVAQNAHSKRKYLSPAINHTVAISQNIKSVLIECGFKPESVTVVPSAVDAEIYKNLNREWSKQKLIKQFQLSEDTFLIGCASALVKVKGHVSLIDAYKEVLKSNPKLHLLLAGEGVFRPELEAYIQAQGLKEKVTFLGHIDNVPEFLCGLDLMVMPSLVEGLGTIVLDAISSGTPVIGSRAGGIPEMIIHEKTGLSFEPGQAQDLELNLRRIITDSSLRNQLLKNAQNHIAQNFSLENMVKGNIQVYKKVLS
jgi:L-malate glycosyltransferase